MASHTKAVILTDLQQQILSNDLYNDSDNAGLDAWVQEAVDGKINSCWKRMQQEWTKKLMDDMKMHQDKMDLQESKMMIDDENKDEDRKLKEAQMAMDSAEKLTSNVDSIISTTIGRS